MRPFDYQRPGTLDEAVTLVAFDPEASYIAGGSNLVDHLKLGVATPSRLVDVRGLPLDDIEVTAAGLRIGANVRNSDLAAHRAVRSDYPVLSRALLAGASAQIRHQATTAGNLLQRTRCVYFADATTPCNKREPGSGCSAIGGYDRYNAVLGTSGSCVATHPSDLAVALAVLDASVEVLGADGARTLPLADLHRLPGDAPEHDTTLVHGELITAVTVPALPARCGLDLLQGPRPGVVRLRTGLRRGGRRRRRRAGGVGRHRPPALARETTRGGTARRNAGRGHRPRGLRRGAHRRRHQRRQRLQDRDGLRRDRHGAHRSCRWCPMTAQAPRSPDLRIKEIGTARPRVDGALKVTGRATYAVEYAARDGVHEPLHVWIVASTIARGRVTAVHADEVRATEGVVAVLDHTSAPRLADVEDEEYAVLQDDEVHFRGQIVALVLATTSEVAREGARRVQVDYAEVTPELAFDRDSDGDVPESLNGDLPPSSNTGRADLALDSAVHVVDATYVTPHQHNNPLEPHASTARWEGVDDAAELRLFDSTQSAHGVRATLARLFALPPGQVHVVASYVGGGFGSKGRPHAHNVAVALAAQAHPGRWVRLAVTRQQMFTLTGYRTGTYSHFRLGADADGRLTAIDHDVLEQTARWKEFSEQTVAPTRHLYAAPNRHTATRLARLDVAVPSWMRAPGEMPGVFAHEVAMDELADACGLDPIELRRRNEPTVDPESGSPFGDRRLIDCFERGAEEFGWDQRRPPGSRVEQDWYVGLGTATATYPAYTAPGNLARIRAEDAGRYSVAIGATDIGTGAWTVLAQIAADALDVDLDAVDLAIGSSDLPMATVAGGSSGTSSWGWAIVGAAEAFRAEHGGSPDPGAETTAGVPDTPVARRLLPALLRRPVRRGARQPLDRRGAGAADAGRLLGGARGQPDAGPQPAGRRHDHGSLHRAVRGVLARPALRARGHRRPGQLPHRRARRRAGRRGRLARRGRPPGEPDGRPRHRRDRHRRCGCGRGQRGPQRHRHPSAGASRDRRPGTRLGLTRWRHTRATRVRTQSCTTSRLGPMVSTASREGSTDGRRAAAAARRRRREGEILDATRALFDERGVRDAQIEDIAKAVGINRAIVYRHFTGKEELFALTLVGYLDELRAELLRAAESAGTPADCLSAMVSAFVDYGVAHPAFVDCAQSLMRRTGTELLQEISENAMFRLGRGISGCLAVLSNGLRAGVDDRRLHGQGPRRTREHALRQRAGRPAARPRRHPGHGGVAGRPHHRLDLARPGQAVPRGVGAGAGHPRRLSRLRAHGAAGSIPPNDAIMSSTHEIAADEVCPPSWGPTRGTCVMTSHEGSVPTGPASSGSAPDSGSDVDRARHLSRMLADRIVAIAHPQTVLVVGCGRGLLVQALADQGVDARGIDDSDAKISAADDDVRPRLEVASPTKPLGSRYDVVTCLDVLADLDPADAQSALDSISAATSRIVFASTPGTGAPHASILSPADWAASFAERGFYRRTDVTLDFWTPWTTLYDVADLQPRDVVHRYEATVADLEAEVREKRAALAAAGVDVSLRTAALRDQLNAAQHQVLTTRDHVIGLEAETAQLHLLVERLNRRLVAAQDRTKKVRARLEVAKRRQGRAERQLAALKGSRAFRIGSLLTGARRSKR